MITLLCQILLHPESPYFWPLQRFGGKMNPNHYCSFRHTRFATTGNIINTTLLERTSAKMVNRVNIKALKIEITSSDGCTNRFK